jgi:glucose dehydrogenase
MRRSSHTLNWREQAAIALRRNSAGFALDSAPLSACWRLWGVGIDLWLLSLALQFDSGVQLKEPFSDFQSDIKCHGMTFLLFPGG